MIKKLAFIIKKFNKESKEILYYHKNNNITKDINKKNKIKL